MHHLGDLGSVGDAGGGVQCAGVSLCAGEMASMCHSPAREELGRRLMKGEALVFVLVESGKKEADEAAGKLLEEQIPILHKTVKVSKVVEDDPLVEGPTLKSKLPVTLEM